MTHSHTKPTVTENRFDDRAALAQALAADIATWVATGLAARPRASLVVSGGSTPVPLFNALRATDIPWPRMDVTLADERWVPVDHAESNERLIRQELLQGPAEAARFVPLMTSAATPEQGLTECANRLREISRPFDVVILGMGDDGHTASLFPHTPALEQGLDIDSPDDCVACRPTTAAHARISLTLQALLDARYVVLHMTGDAKWQVYQQALGGTDQHAMPIRGLLRQQRTPVQVYWAP